MAKNARHKRKCKDKVKHSSQENAIIAIKKSNFKMPMQIYKCIYCKKFHITKKNVRLSRKNPRRSNKEWGKF